MKVNRLTSVLQNLGVSYPKEGESYLDKQRDALFARITLLAGLVMAVKLALDVQHYFFYTLPIVDLLALLVTALSYWFFKRDQVLIAKILCLISLNFFIAIICLFLPRERLIFVYFFPMIAISYAVFSDENNAWKILFIFFSSALLAILILTDFEILGSTQIDVHGSTESNRVLNVMFSIVIIFFCIGFLIRHNHESQNMLHGMTRDIQRKNEDLQKINSELDRFVYSTSHDLRAPLLSIQGLVKIARSECHEPKMIEYLNLIGDRTCKLDDFIQEIIDYSRNARTELKHEPTNMRDLITEIINNLKYIEGAERIQFEMNFSSTDVMMIDRNRIKIVLSNLISNAIKYHNPREEIKWVRVSVTNERNKCQIVIADNGIGINLNSNPVFLKCFSGQLKNLQDQGWGYIL